ncbi:hypothetical protein CHS0354_026579 [Potamilus streckersoni]|uniref:Uncharacterized protein n=1 Tax=Potamilus streckersoni TaxID=2493646 RepID=A0AAE0TJ34_9BIVA|nr:hypothetical protein CHS0354_026579 [Potamilus streckersoni]
MLADGCNIQCTLMSSSYQFVTSLKISSTPRDICVIGDLEGAVSSCQNNTIQILSVKDDMISPVRTLTTNFTSCQRISSAWTGNIAVTGHCDGQMVCWSILSTEGEVKASYQYDYGGICLLSPVIKIEENTLRLRAEMHLDNGDLGLANLSGNTLV